MSLWPKRNAIFTNELYILSKLFLLAHVFLIAVRALIFVTAEQIIIKRYGDGEHIPIGFKTEVVFSGWIYTERSLEVLYVQPGNCAVNYLFKKYFILNF